MLVPVWEIACIKSAKRPWRSSPTTPNPTRNTSPSTSCQSISTRRRRDDVVLGMDQVPPAQFAAQDFPPQRHAGRGLLLLDPLPDLVSRAGGADVVEPVAAGPCLRTGDDRDGVPVLEGAMQRR